VSYELICYRIMVKPQTTEHEPPGAARFLLQYIFVETNCVSLKSKGFVVWIQPKRIQLGVTCQLQASRSVYEAAGREIVFSASDGSRLYGGRDGILHLIW